MSKPLALIAALALAFVSLASTGFAAGIGGLSFTLSEDRNQRLQLGLRHDGSRGISNSDFKPEGLSGLDVAALRSGSGPVRFALIRDPGRIDCSGQSQRRGFAAGECRFTEDQAFTALLAARGFDRPNGEQMIGLTMVGGTRALVEALAAAGYRPGMSDLTGLAALGVTPTYIAEIDRLGVKPTKVRDLMAFKALGISPDYVAGMAREGYRGLGPADLTAMKAIGITPDFIRAFRAAGYGNLPVSTLIQAKAIGVTPEFVRSFRQGSRAELNADELIRLKASGLMP